MKYAKPLVGSAVLIGLMLAASAYVWGKLGDQPIAVHFGIDGRPDGYASKRVALTAMPITALLTAALFAALPPLMPAKARLERSWTPFVVVWQAVLVLLLVIHLALIGHAQGWAVSIARIDAIGIGGLMAVIGNLLGKVRYNYVFGIRTPWTLANERVWDRTHRFGGWAIMLGGLASVLAGVAAPPEFVPLLHGVTLAAVLIPALAAAIYSYLESRRIEREAI